MLCEDDFGNGSVGRDAARLEAEVLTAEEWREFHVGAGLLRLRTPTDRADRLAGVGQSALDGLG